MSYSGVWVRVNVIEIGSDPSPLLELSVLHYVILCASTNPDVNQHQTLL